jgi:hypothetical protein
LFDTDSIALQEAAHRQDAQFAAVSQSVVRGGRGVTDHSMFLIYILENSQSQRD